jgi:hypothetical protein
MSLDCVNNSDVQLQDEDGYLSLYHYKECTNESSTWLKAQRGIIKDADQNVVCESFGYTPEYAPNDMAWKNQVRDSIHNCKVFLSEEGTLLRLFFYNRRWHLSTHKRIDSFSSRWSSTLSFGEIFLQALEYYFLKGDGVGKIEVEDRADLYDCFCATLDPTRVYTFLVRMTDETRIVCKPPTAPTVYFAGCFYHGMRLEGNPTLLPYPVIVPLKSVEEVETYVNQLDPLRYQGVIVFTNDQQSFKVVHPMYAIYAKIRGSEPSVQRAYLRIRESDEFLQQFLMLFPDKNEMAKDMEEKILHLARQLHQYYAKRFIRKEYVVVNKHYFYMMRLAHMWHNENRPLHVVSVQKFLELLDKQPATFLYVLLSQ